MSKKIAVEQARKSLAEKTKIPIQSGAKVSGSAELIPPGVGVSGVAGAGFATSAAATAPGGVTPEYQPPELVAKIQGLREKAVAVITALGEVASKYYALCLYIRKTPGLNDTPKLVSQELAAMGFKRSRISEIRRVAYAADDVFATYEAKLIGFDKALEMARIAKPGDTPGMTPAAKLLTDAKVMTGEEMDSAIKHEVAPSGGSGGKSDFEKCKAAAKVLCKLSTGNGHTYRFDDCKYYVKVIAC